MMQNDENSMTQSLQAIFTRSMKGIFCEVVRYAAEIEKDGRTLPRSFFIRGGARDLALQSHIDLLASDPQYSKLFNDFKEAGRELDAMVAAIPPEELEKIVEKIGSGEPLDPAAMALEQKLNQQQEGLFAIYLASQPF